MSKQVRTLVALDEGVDRHAVQSALPVDAWLNVVGVVDGLDDGWTTLQETAIDLVVVGCKGYSDKALFFIESAVKQDPQRPLVVLSEGSMNGFVRRVFDAGADDIVNLGDSSEALAFALQKAIARKQRSVAAATTLAPLVCVLGPKGGTGKTLTTANLAVSLASGGRHVVAVDLDLQFGDLGLSLGLSPERTIYDLATSGGSLDAEKVGAFLTTHASGVRVLLAPTRPDQSAAVTVPLLRDLYSALRSSFDYVLVDTPPGFTPEVIASVDNATSVCVVGMLDSLSLKNTKLGLETLELMGYDRDRVHVVLNRADSKVGISRDDVEAILGRKPDVLVPSDREIPRAVNRGMPIVSAQERSEAARAFRSLAALVADEASPLRDDHPSRNGRRKTRLLALGRR